MNCSNIMNYFMSFLCDRKHSLFTFSNSISPPWPTILQGFGWCLKVVPRNVEGGLFFWHHGWLLLKKISPRKRYTVSHFLWFWFFCLFAQNVFKISNLISSAQHNLWVPKLFLFMNFLIWALLVPQIWLLNVFWYF